MFLFNTWIGGVICCFVLLLIVGTPIINWINKEKAKAIEEAKHLKEKLHQATGSSHSSSSRSSFDQDQSKSR